jgi:ABC-2 type transport system ATP-binding protein
MLSTTHLSKHYGSLRALDDVSLTLLPGQFCALLGPNGAGKSTLFQLLTGLFVPDQGAVSIDGLSLQKYPAQALARIGVVFQQQALDLDLTVRRNLQFHADLHGLNRAAASQRIAEIAERLGMGGMLERSVRQLSGGSRRKVELIRALLHRPGLILMDEATVGLDPQSRHDMLAVIREEVSLRRCCVLWATHRIDEAEQADRVLLLHQGQLIADGSPAEVTAALGQPTLEQGFMQRTRQTVNSTEVV